MLDEASAWQALLDLRRELRRSAGRDAREGSAGLPEARRDDPAAAALIELYLPFCRPPPAGLVIAHLGQSLDGRIATSCGASRWVTGPLDRLHGHRMRALADAVVVGAGTVRHDDPQLTVRDCPGRHPVRVVIDAERRLDPGHRIFQDDAAPTLVIAASDRAVPGERLGHAEILPVARDPVTCDGAMRDGAGLAPAAIRAALARRGLKSLYLEGGGVTVSRFLAAGCLDRLQLTIAPLIIGSGRPSIALGEIADLAQGHRPRVRRFVLGEDIMVECIFRE